MDISEKNEKLIIKLNSLLQEYGFKEILLSLEQVASNNAESINGPWEIIRKNLEDSILEMEEWNINSYIN